MVAMKLIVMTTRRKLPAPLSMALESFPTKVSVVPEAVETTIMLLALLTSR